MNDKSDKKHKTPQESWTPQTDDLELSSRQSEIYQNLEAIGPEIAAYYRDGIRILQNENLETAASLLGHIAREIDGGLRDVLSEKRKEELEFIIGTPDGSELTYEKGRADTFNFTCNTPGTFTVTYNRIEGHKPSILKSLGINTPSPLAERWLKVSKKFYRFDHRRGAWKPPRTREEFVPLWCEFEDVLADLVGNYLNLLSKVVDRILASEEPTDEMRGVLLNLLKSDSRCKYFFEKLDSPAWLEPLKENGWFDPESNVIVRPYKYYIKEPDQSAWWKPLIDAGWFDPESSSLMKARTRTIATDTISPWYALEYVERIAEHIKDHPCDGTSKTLAEIIDTIVGGSGDTKEKIIKDSTLSERMIKIIYALPKEKRKDKHLDFAKSAMSAWENRNENVRAYARKTHRLYESIEQDTNPALKELLSNMSGLERIEFLEQIREGVDEKNHLTEQGLANVSREYLGVILQRFTSFLSVFQDVLFPDHYSILTDLLTALHDRKKFDWEALLGCIHELLSLEHFWIEQEVNGSKYRNQILANTAELIVIGTNNDDWAFDPKLLPLAEQILLILVEKAESSRIIQEDPYSTFLNSSKGMVFWAMMEYTLRLARIKNTKQMDFRWPQAIRANFTKRLDKNIESSFEFSFALGAFLSQLLYFDRKWVIDNINCIFPMQDEHHWYVTFSAYLLSSNKSHKSLGFLLKEGGHYQKALNTNFADHSIEIELAKHICTFWLENSEDLDDKTSLIYQVLNSTNLNFLSAVLGFFSDQIDNLPEENKAKVRSTFRVLLKVLSENKDEKVCRKIFGESSKWIALIDRIDEEALEWLKLSVRYVTWDIRILLETLLTHASKTPREVGIIYLELSKRGIGKMLGSFLDRNKVIETIRILYEIGYEEIADQICIQFAENGLDFLKPIYNEYQP